MLVFALLLCLGNAFMPLPGVAPKEYQNKEEVELKVQKLDSVQTQLPYDYYSLPFCQPETIREAAENLGEILSGDRIENSLYKIEMRATRACRLLCRLEYDDSQLAQFAERIEEEYRVNWLVDNLPAATRYFLEVQSGDSAEPEYEEHYEKGFPLGFMGSQDQPETTPGVAYINNHVRLVLKYHEDQQAFKGYRIVGFEVEPYSVKHVVDGEWAGDDTQFSTCSPLNKVVQGMQPQPVSGTMSKSDKTIIWTYDVQWDKSEIKWASRWDLYLKMTDSQIHWFSIINSITIVLFLSGMVGLILVRTLHRDLRRYNEIDNSEEAQQEETGWKLIHGDVFRPPSHGGMFSILVGTGAQVCAMTILTLVFAVFGFLSPANRGALMTALLLLFVFMGMVKGYFTTRLYTMFKLTEWKSNTLAAALLLPGILFGGFFFLNIFVSLKHSSGAVPFGTLIALLVLWLGISLPLVYCGSYVAYKKPAIEPPLRVNHIPRVLLPDRPWYTQAHTAILIGGVLPFGAVFIEIFFIMQSVWLHQYYYLFGVLFIVFVILIITCAEITIVMCYFQLCNEDYHWWWRSYLTSGSSALYLFLYSFVYFFTKLRIIQFVSGLLFFGYMFMVSVLFFTLTGTIGFAACYLFVHKIYSSIKVD